MTVPRVYKAIHAVAADLAGAGLSKASFNTQDQYAYRSIDDLLNRLAPLLRKHRLCVLPRVLDRVTAERATEQGGSLVNVTLRIAFDLVSASDGSMHSVEAFGEASDGSDKGTAKAMTAAYKSAMFQTFCIPVGDDADAESPKPRELVEPEPLGGWEQWCRGIIDTIGVCESLQAVDRVQSTHRKLLLALSRERPALYAQLGTEVSAKRAALAQPPSAKRAVEPSTGSVRQPVGAGA